MTHKPATPIELIAGSAQLCLMLAEAQMVIAYRLLGVAGLWAVAKTENRRMVDEKGPAFWEASFAATRAAMEGRRPDEILGAYVGPLRQRTRRNALRLGRRGPRLR